MPMRNQDDGILYDFPCSYTFRAYEAEQYGEHLPDIEPRQRPPQDVEVQHTYFHVDNSRRILARLDDLERPIKYLLKKDKQKGAKGKSYPSSPKNILILNKGGGEEGGI